MTERQESSYNASTDFEIEDSNRSSNPHFSDVLRVNLARRRLVQGTAAVAAVGLATPVAAKLAAGLAPDFSSNYVFGKEELKSLAMRPSFPAIAVTRDNSITVPNGYSAQVICKWGEPLFSDGPAFRTDRGNTAADQQQQIGMHHDGMHYFPLRTGRSTDQRGLLVINHEYIDQGAMHPNGATVVDGARPAEEVAKEVAAHGVSVVEVVQSGGQWQQADGQYNRRITGETLMELSGPVRGHAKVRTKFSADGTQTRGTLNNCGNGITPWGTYLTCEENWAGYFANRDAERPREHARYGVPSGNSRYGWDTAQERFDASSKGASASADFRNEPNTFGYIVEIDPFDAKSVPKKRTAMGRFGHEGCIYAPPKAGRPVVFYSGDDAQNEYIYKFVTQGAFVPLQSGLRRDLLDSGTLYVARFAADGTGEWLAIDIDNPALQAAAAAAGVSFADQGDVILNTRLAADLLGATKMDRPEWGAVDPISGEVYFTLTNNSRRAADAVDAANPRGPNAFGHILRWRPTGDDHTADGFAWEIYVLSGTESDSAILPGAGGNRKLSADSIHASPDGLWFDRGGMLWIQTDMSGSQLASGPFGNNAMLAADPVSGEIRRFLAGPGGCEVTGITMTPDMRSVFVNIQHPGEGGGDSWPDGGSAPPRSATVVVTRNDGGIIGT